METDGGLSAQEQMYILYDVKLQCHQNLSNRDLTNTGTPTSTQHQLHQGTHVELETEHNVTNRKNMHYNVPWFENMQNATWFSNKHTMLYKYKAYLSNKYNVHIEMVLPNK